MNNAPYSCTEHPPIRPPETPSVQPLSRRHLRLNFLRLRLWATPSETHHTPHHVKQRIPLPRNADPKIHLANLRQRVVPNAHLLNIRRVMSRQLLVQIRAPPLHSQQQQTEEVEEGERRVHAHVGGGAADFLQREGLVRGAEPGGEDQEGFVRGAEIRC